jgi:hypothetical protein
VCFRRFAVDQTPYSESYRGAFLRLRRKNRAIRFNPFARRTGQKDTASIPCAGESRARRGFRLSLCPAFDGWREKGIPV